MKNCALLSLSLCLCTSAYADSPLYETGPSQDSSFVRFVNVGEEKVTVVNGNARLSLSTAGEARASRFFPVKAGAKLAANVQAGNGKVDVELVAKPGEFLTVAVSGQGNHLESTVLRESPTDFNAMRSSIAVFNTDSTCANASLAGGAKNTAIFDALKPGAIARRLLNPVKLSAQVSCDGQAVAKPIDFGQLQAGERYSIFIIKAKNGRQAFFVKDSNS